MGAQPSISTFKALDAEWVGNVYFVPRWPGGRAETEMARAMAAALVDANPASATEAFKQLRAAFPHSPLTARVAALGVLMERLRRPAES